jgi:hypothetical protein
MARRRKRIDEETRARWGEGFHAHVAGTAANPDPIKAAPSDAIHQSSLGPGFVQMRTIQDLPPPITLPLSSLQRVMLWAAWQGELWHDGRGVVIAGCRVSIVTLHALRRRGLLQKGGGQIGVTQDGLVALELLYTDPREWSTPIEATTRTLIAS